MPGIFQSLDIARRAIWASRLGMDVTSHNIANVNTPGYSRQRVENRAANPLQLPQGQLGLGVRSGDIVRVRSNLLDNQFRQNAFVLGKATIQESLFTQVESIFQEPSEAGIANLMTEFFSEFSNLAANPENSAIRNTVRQKAVALTDSFNQKNEQLNLMRHSIRKEAGAAINQVNEITRQIADLNRQITTAEAGSGKANDLRDRRDLLLDRLAEYVNVSYSENSRGQISVNAEGMSLVSGDKARQLSLITGKNGKYLHLQVENGSGRSQSMNYGKLGGLLEMVNNTLPNLQDRLDNLAKNLAEEVNRLHAAGKGLPTGEPPTASTGVDFFSGSGAGTIRVSDEIMEDLSRIAASGDGTPGNGDVATAIANLRNQKILGGGNQTLNEYYTTLVNDLGIKIQKAQNTADSQELLKNQIMNQRESVSGVSLDEEMTNLIKFQRSFEAAAKIVQTVDEVMETMINMV